jgi:hypothetical protein
MSVDAGRAAGALLERALRSRASSVQLFESSCSGGPDDRPISTTLTPDHVVVVDTTDPRERATALNALLADHSGRVEAGRRRHGWCPSGQATQTSEVGRVAKGREMVE